MAKITNRQARKDRPCNQCGGIIRRGMGYFVVEQYGHPRIARCLQCQPGAWEFIPNKDKAALALSKGHALLRYYGVKHGETSRVDPPARREVIFEAGREALVDLAWQCTQLRRKLEAKVHQLETEGVPQGSAPYKQFDHDLDVLKRYYERVCEVRQQFVEGAADHEMAHAIIAVEQLLNEPTPFSPEVQ